MNFDAYKINKIFYDHISSLIDPWKYGFALSHQYSYPGKNYYYEVNFDKFRGPSHWNYAPHFFNKDVYTYDLNFSFYQIDQHHFIHHHYIHRGNKVPHYYMLINTKKKNKKNKKMESASTMSLQELVLFMIYVKYLSRH